MNRYVVIAGVGRSGTSFLVQLLTHVGVATGFTPAEVDEVLRLEERAGLETDIRNVPRVRVVKSPHFVEYVDEVLASPAIGLDHVLIPIRTVADAAESRRRVHRKGLERAHPIARLKAMARGTSFPGGVPTASLRSWRRPHPRPLEDVLARELYELCHSLTAAEIPLQFLSFPRFVTDPEYLYARLAVALPELERDAFTAAFHHVSRPGLVHCFDPGPDRRAGERYVPSASSSAPAAAGSAPATIGSTPWGRLG